MSSYRLEKDKPTITYGKKEWDVFLVEHGSRQKQNGSAMNTRDAARLVNKLRDSHGPETLVYADVRITKRMMFACVGDCRTPNTKKADRKANLKKIAQLELELSLLKLALKPKRTHVITTKAPVRPKRAKVKCGCANHSQHGVSCG